MGKVICIDEFYERKIEEGELFAICLNNVEDDIGLYLEKGYVYEVVGMTEDCWFIEGEDCTIQCKKTDSDIKIVVSGEVS